MKKSISLIKFHSFVSVITNSSTELFVGDQGKTLEVIKEGLQKIIDGYNTMVDGSYTMEMFDEPFIFSLKEYRAWKKKDVELRAEAEKTGEWKEYWQSDERSQYSTISGWFHDDGDEKEMEEMRKDVIQEGKKSTFMGFSCSGGGNPYQSRLDEASRDKDGKWDYKGKKKEVDKIYKEIVKSSVKPDWWNEPWVHAWNSKLVKELDGCVILCGAEDNSVPYDIWDHINNLLNGENYHLG